MVLDQNEIDAMLAEHAGAGEPAAAGAMPGPTSPDAASSGTAIFAREGLVSGTATLQIPSAPEVQRLLKLRVPIIVRIAVRKLSIHEIRRFSRGRIIEFDTPSDTPLELLINNRVIGHGEPVRVGDYYGLKIAQICDRRQRIQSMGG